MNFSLKVDGETNSGELCDLFGSESKYPSEYYFWQDRKPDFFAFYSHLKTQPATYLKWIDAKGRTRICFGVIPIGEMQGSPICYLTDFFADPAIRNSKEVWRFVEASCHFFRENFQTSLCWGLENRPGVLRGFSRMLARVGFGFKYFGLSLMREFYLSGERSTQYQASLEKVERLEGKEILNSPDVFSFLKFAPENRPIFAPSLSISGLDKLLKTDPNLTIIKYPSSVNRNKCLLLVDFGKVRKLCSTGKKSELMKGQSWGDELRQLIVSPIGPIDESDSTLVRAAFEFANLGKYDLLSLRDMKLGHEFAQMKRQLVYSRRAFALYSQLHPHWPQIFQDVRPETRINLESSFL
ncbi:MAG: hypothetical protein IPJ71_01885 [Bdellovibrionales bacterium]|nr:hypothetical protein [Bdellovibrionales bacterium]